MKKEVVVIVLILTFLISFAGFSMVSAVSSGTNTTFFIPGCDLPGGKSLSVGTCLIDKSNDEGRYFCNLSGTLLNTLNDKYGCSLGFDQAVSDPCCPVGYRCDFGVSWKCVPRSIPCSQITNQRNCEDSKNQCFWDPKDKKCAEQANDLACSYYKNKTACENDLLDLGQKGLGTEDCGKITSSNDTYGTIKCFCKWGVQDGCFLNKEIKPIICPIGGCNTPSYNCVKYFNFGPCIDGKQFVNWSAQLEDESGNPVNGIFQNECSSGNMTRSCGKEVVKMPGFSVFALIASIVAIATIYFLRKDLE